MKSSHCIVIPNYNHTQHIEQVLQAIEPLNLPVIMVNDGSNQQTHQILNQLPEQFNFLQVINLAENSGKGAAVMAGLLAAHQQGFSHAIQVDADGQHNLKDIPNFIALSSNYPEAVICGIPDYDDSVPLGRLIPRYLTHFWVWVETLSFKIKDSMCGYRLYPLAATVQLLQSSTIGKRMDFDTEILVKLYWASVDIVNFPTKVTYPDDGSSHFRMVKDNWLITKMHTKLVFGMLIRSPKLIARHFKRGSKRLDPHWSTTKERGTTFGIQILVWLYRIFGQWLFRVALVPVIAYFIMTASKARNASYEFLQRVNRHNQSSKKVRWYHVYFHFYQFGLLAIDKIRGWLGDVHLKDLVFHNPDVFDKLRKNVSKTGAVFIGSHLGNLELCRAIGATDPSLKINALVFTKHALKFQTAVEKFNPKASINLIQVDTLGPETAIMLKDKVDAGEVVIIVGDRTSISQPGRVNYAPFLGYPAPFSQGPFILASILECPIYLLFCLKQSGQYHVYLEPFADSLKLARRNKSEQLQSIIERYSERLEYYCLKAPYQWFNFFTFWQKDDQQHIQRSASKTQETHHRDRH